ncbi:MAG TPA: cupin domain-containing protein [Bacillus sp. (in: firmicutes)]|nr:cupin domain-containing protein [Bacillus sp. (in: firmicutes)]
MKISKENALHYIWGETCDGWHLVKDEALSIIHERMPADTCEVRHYHEKSRQFFFMLTGCAMLEVNGEEVMLYPNEGVEVPPLVPHQMFNRSNEDIEFLVISQPNSKGDRIADKKQAKNA